MVKVKRLLEPTQLKTPARGWRFHLCLVNSGYGVSALWLTHSGNNGDNGNPHDVFDFIFSFD